MKWSYDCHKTNGIRWKRTRWLGIWVRDSRIAGPSTYDRPGRLYWFGPYRFRFMWGTNDHFDWDKVEEWPIEGRIND